MCGICGVVALDGVLDPRIAAAVPAMRDSLRHRGPDGAGLFADAHVALGHRRLAIIDMAGGVQPLSNEDGSCWVTFNGEIYNHRRLRQRLTERGHVFRTASDTEVIVHAYEEYGAGCVEQLDGMFAFAVYDQRHRRVLLARDRLGKKPLYYAVLDGVLHFASEIKAFYHSPAWDGAIDLDNLEGYLSLGYSIAPRTMFRRVQQLEPGHYLIAQDGALHLCHYWDVQEFDTDPRAEQALTAELDARLREAVRARLESDVPLGAFLSGGIDSGLVVSYMAEVLGDRLVATSVGFSSTGHDETATAAVTAVHCGARHYREAASLDFGDMLERVGACFDEPFADSSAVPTYHVSALARRHVTVALSGDGGDEPFAGYGFRYVPHAIEQRIRSAVPTVLQRPLFTGLDRAWPETPMLPRLLRLSTVWKNLAVDEAGAYYRDLCFLKPERARHLLGRTPSSDPRTSPIYEAVTAPYRRCASKSAVQRAQYADLKIYLPNDVLVKVDRMSMAHGLEVRSPLLDYRLIEFAFRVPAARKLSRLQPKRLLRTLAGERLPAEVSRLPKRGFTAPVAEWLAGPAAERFSAEVLANGAWIADVVDQDCARRLFVAHRRREADHSYALWALWVLNRWGRASRDARRVAA